MPWGPQTPGDTNMQIYVKCIYTSMQTPSPRKSKTGPLPVASATWYLSFMWRVPLMLNKELWEVIVDDKGYESEDAPISLQLALFID